MGGANNGKELELQVGTYLFYLLKTTVFPNHKHISIFLFLEKECCLQKLKERKKFLRSSSLEIQGHILGASGDRVKAQGQHNAGGDWKKSPSNICCSGTNTNRNTHLPPFVTFWTI